MKNIDRIVVRVAVLLFITLLVSQAALVYVPGWGDRLNAALRLEGRPLQNKELLELAGNTSTAPWATLSLKLQGYASRPDIRVYVDSQEAGSFLSNEVILTVKHGNIISVENPDQAKPVTVLVSKKTANVMEPRADSRVSGSGLLYFEPVVVK